MPIDLTTNVSNAIISNMATSNHADDQLRMLGLDDHDMNTFGKILRTMRLEKIADFASTVRQYGHRSTGNNLTQDLADPCLISCRVINPPLCGSFHIIFPIEFVDGVTWMLKIPASGYRFGSVAAAALVSEARTMQMLRKETSIPVPAVYAFETSSENTLSSPFILMEKLCGRPLYHLWFDSEKPKACLEHWRVKALQSLAGAMVQLNKFTLNTGGSLVFDSDGTLVGLSGAKAVDGVAMFNKARAPQFGQDVSGEEGKNIPSEVRVDPAESHTLNATDDNQGDADESDDEDIIYERGPFNCPKAYFLSNLDRSDKAFRADAYDRGTDMSLRLFSEWAFANSRNQGGNFVLTHPDLDVQNILVAEDGTLTGLIDWDGVAAVPREVGCAQYPLWLMRDWVPSRYRYDIEKGEAYANAGYEESSPAELASYRALYAQLMEVEIGKMTGGSNKTTTFGTSPKYEAGLTRRSLIMRSLDLSAGDPWVALSTVNYIIDQIEELTATEWEDTDSDSDSVGSCSSVSGSVNTTDSDSDDEADNEAATPEANEQDFHVMRGNASTHEADLTSEMERIVPEVDGKANHSPWKEEQQHQMSPNSSKACRARFEEPKPRESSKSKLRDNSVACAPLGWMRKLLRFGCNTAEKSLREIAKIGYVNGDIEEEGELAKPGVQQTETSMEEHSGQRTNLDTSQQTNLVAIRKDTVKEQFKGIPTTQNTVEPEQLNVIQPAAELHGSSSTQTAVESRQTKEIRSIQPTVEAQDIPLRKAELLETAKLERKAARKANYRASKAAIKQELKVWERIALATWSRGIPLELLQKNETKIYRWIVDTLKAEQAREKKLALDPHLPSAVEAVAAAGEMVDSNSAALNPGEDDEMQLKEASGEFWVKEDVLQTAKFGSNGSSRTSKVSVAGIAEDDRVEATVHQTSLEKPSFTTAKIPGPEDIMFDIREDNKDEPESPIGVSCAQQVQARSSPARNSRTSKSNGGRWIAKKPVAAKGGKTWPELGHENPPLSESAVHTMAPDKCTSLSHPKVPISKGELVGRSNLGRQSVSEGHVLPEEAKADHSLSALCKSGASYPTQIILNINQTKPNKGLLPANSNTQSDSDSDDEKVGSDSGAARSSATSLSDGEAENEKIEEFRDDKDDTPEVTGICANQVDHSEDGGEEDDEEHVGDGREEGRLIEVFGHHGHAALIKGALEEDGNTDSCTPRRVYDTCSGEWVETNETHENTTAGSTIATGDEAQFREPKDTGDGELRDDTGNEDKHDDRADEDGGEDPLGESDLPPFEDHGGFDRYTVCNLLGMGELDELRLLRLKEGFLKLLEQY